MKTVTRKQMKILTESSKRFHRTNSKIRGGKEFGIQEGRGARQKKTAANLSQVVSK